jgi:hypothetical protein
MTLLHDITVLLCAYIASLVIREYMKGGDYMGDPSLNGRIILK